MEIGIGTTMWEKMAQVSPDMLCAFDQDGYFVMASEASRSILGYSSDALVGHHYTDFLHPDYLLLTQKAVQDVLGGFKLTNFENCLIHRNGSVVAILWSAVWSEEEKAIFCVARDITELKSNRIRFEESEQLYRTLFDNNPDVIFIQDREGLVMDVNQSFCDVFQLSKQDALKRPTTSFLPPETVPVCLRYFHESMQGKTSRYDIDFITADNERRTYDIVKFPIYSNGEVTYIKTILKDITKMIHSFKTIQQQADKLNKVFESITDAFFTLDRNWRLTYLNSEAERLLQLDRRHHLGENILKLFPKEVSGEFQKHYLKAFETGKATNFTSCSKVFDMWLHVKAFPSSEGLSVYFEDVTEHVKSRQELEKLSLVASKTTNGVIIKDKDGRIEWVNDGFTRLTGYSLEEAVGKLPTELLLRHEEEVKAFDLLVQRMVSGEDVSFEILNYKKNGEEIWFSVQINQVYDREGEVCKVISVQNDITEQVRARQELEKLSLVASGTDNGVIITDASGLTEWVNEGFTKMTGYTLPEMVGRKPGELLQGEETEESNVRMMREKLMLGAHFSVKLINYKKSGERFWVSMDITPVYDRAGAITKFIAIQKDITYRKESESKLLKMTQDLYAQNSDLQQFTYLVSHNLRAPVANALGLANLMTKVPKESELFDSCLVNLNQSITQLDTVLRDITTILTIRDSKGNLEQEQVDICAVIGEVLSSLQEPLEKCGGEVINDVEEGTSVRVNKAYLYSIFYNFLSNAIKYRSEERALVVRIKSFSSADKGTFISFSDNGSGFDTEKAGDNIFKLYKRFHKNKKGRGVGLYLVKTHLEAMGGHIEVNSKVGVGTRFIFSLPKHEHDSLPGTDALEA